MVNQTQGQQGQQQYDDDILGGEDIFATIPEAIPEEDLPYGDLLEKKYQFEPIPEVEDVPEDVLQEQQSMESGTPESLEERIEEQLSPEQEYALETVAQEEMEKIDQETSLEQEKVDTLLDTKLQTDIQKKFGELFFGTKKIYELRTKLGIQEETFDILGADNDKVFISYRCMLDQAGAPRIFITKIEQNKETQEETVNELRFEFNEETLSLEVVVNDTLIFDEIKDLTEDPKKKMQVVEKLNKFIFLTSEEIKKLEKEIQRREEEEREKKRLQEIFRNF